MLSFFRGITITSPFLLSTNSVTPSFRSGGMAGVKGNIFKLAVECSLFISGMLFRDCGN
ncbi:MAG: hypothetical protein ACLUDU_13400 [Butyricimonas faecihominis]